MRVIGIDPGYERLGVAVVEGKTLLYSDCFKTSATLPFPERLRLVGDEVARLITEYTPKALAIEKLYFNTNQKTGIAVAQVIGAVTYIAQAHGLTVHEYTPPQIKVACTSNGRADKKQVMAMLPHLITIDKKITYDDEFDAIAVALTHLAHTA